MKEYLVSLIVSLSFVALITPHSVYCEGQTTSPSPTPVVSVGVILPLTGPFAREGKKVQEAIAQIAPKHLHFIFEDEACDGKKAIDAYQKLSQLNGIKLFFGPWCGSPQHAIAPLLHARDQVALLSASASEELFTLSHGRMFSTQPSIETESTFLAKQMNKAGIKSVVTVFYENNFSRAHEAAFIKAFTGKILDTFAYTSEDITNLKNIALKIKRLHPDAIYMPDAFPLLAGITKELHAIGVGSTPIYSVYSVQSEDLLNVVGAQGEGLKYSFPDSGDETPAYFYALKAVKILQDAVKVCGDTPQCILNELKKHPFDQHGMLRGQMVLKEIRGRAFVKSKD